MVQRIVIILLLSLLVFSLTAQQGDLSAEEYQRRNVELQRLANRFKQETGFEGNIQFNHQMMKLSHFMGNFENVTFPPASDLIAVTVAVNQVFELILPFLPASREQLTIESITGDERGVRAQIRQTVNGYEIEGAGILRIFYEYEKNRVTIMNALVSIDPTPVTPRITEEEAIRMFDKK